MMFRHPMLHNRPYVCVMFSFTRLISVFLNYAIIYICICVYLARPSETISLLFVLEDFLHGSFMYVGYLLKLKCLVKYGWVSMHACLIWYIQNWVTYHTSIMPLSHTSDEDTGLKVMVSQSHLKALALSQSCEWGVLLNDFGWCSLVVKDLCY